MQASISEHSIKEPPMQARSPRLFIGCLCLLGLAVARDAVAQRTAPKPASPSADREAVQRAVLDYVEGFYEGDSTKLVRSIRPEFYKYGFYWMADSSKYVGMQMTWQAAMGYARRVKERNNPAPPTAPKVVQVFDVTDQTASAKLTAMWGIDYLLLGKYNGQWMISHVMWQSPPPTP
jgi:hypothetical protein